MPGLLRLAGRSLGASLAIAALALAACPARAAGSGPGVAWHGGTAVPRDTLRGIRINIKNADEMDDEVYDFVGSMPTFPGGAEEFRKWLKRNLVYPESAIAERTEGIVVVSFIVRADGTLVEPVIEESIGPEFDDETLRLVGAMPKWKAGEHLGEKVNVKYTLPIYFGYEEPQAEPEPVPQAEQAPLVVVDGREMDFEDISSLDPSTIGEIKALKGRGAIDAFGEKARCGALVITLRKDGD